MPGATLPVGVPILLLTGGPHFTQPGDAWSDPLSQCNVVWESPSQNSWGHAGFRSADVVRMDSMEE
jgi:hypothetical protein